MDQKEKTQNGHKKRMLIIAGTLILIALIIVIISSRNGNMTSNAVIGQGEIDAIYYEDEVYLDENYGGIEPSFVAEEKMVAQRAMGIASDTMIAPEFPQDDSIPRPENASHVIKIGNFSLRVISLDEAANTIKEIAQNYGGDITAANFSTRGAGTMYGYITVKVPVDDFEGAMSDIKKIATIVENESVTTSDVSEQIIDLNANLTNRKAQEERLRAFFDEAENVKDLLAVESQLTVVRGEIERIEGRLKSLTNRTSFSTITIQLSEDAQIVVPSDHWRPLEVAKDAVNNLIKSFQTIIDSAINVAISSLPLFLLSLLGLWIVYIIGKKLVIFISNRIHKEEGTTD